MSLITNNPSQRVLNEGFRLVNLSSSPHLYSAIERIVNTSLTPLYGEQSTKLAEIKERVSSYRCEVLLKREEAVGFIIYKSDLKPFCRRGVNDSLELCHLELLNPRRDSGLGYRTQLIDRVEEIAKERLANSIHTTIANRDPLRSYLLDWHFRQDDAIPPDTRAGRPATLLYYFLKNNSNNNEINHTESKKRESDDVNNNNKKIKIEESQPPKPEVRQITLPRQYIHQIRNGTKTIEGRINSGQFKHIKAGDKIRFFYTQNPSDDVTCEVTEVKPYPSFPAMLTAEGYKKCVPELTTYQAACQAYDRIPNYTANAALHGVLAIHIKKV